MKKIFTTLFLSIGLSIISQTSITPTLTSINIASVTTSINSNGFTSNWNFPLTGSHLTSSVTTQSLYYDSVIVSFDYSFTSNSSGPHYYEISVNNYSLTVTELGGNNLIGTITQTINVNCGDKISFYTRSFGGWSNASQTVVVSNITLSAFNPCVAGIRSLDNLNINVYSISNSLIVENPNNIENINIDVFNLSGQLIHSSIIQDNKIDLNVSNGLYVVKLSKGNQCSIKKIIIN